MIDLKNFEGKISQKGVEEEAWSNERNFYTQQINQLLFHNQNLGNINMQLGGQNQGLKENMVNLERCIEDLMRRGPDIESDYKRKL